MYDEEMAQRLACALVTLERDGQDGDNTVCVKTFQEAGENTRASGLVVTYGSDGSRYRVTVEKV